MSLLREVKPRNARTARIVKSREPQLTEDRKRVLLLHGSKCPIPVHTVLKTISTLTKPHSVMLNKKNGDIHPFSDAQSIEFLAGKNDCGLVVFGTHSKKRPNNITVSRIYNNKTLDMAELLLLNTAEELQSSKPLEIGIEMKPLILFAGSQWDDESTSDSAALHRTLKSLLLDLFQGEEIASIDVAGLQYILMIASGEPSSSSTTPTTHSHHPSRTLIPPTSQPDPTQNPVLHLRWYKIQTTRSSDSKLPRAELQPLGPPFDFRVGRTQLADPEILRDALKHARRAQDGGRTKKNIETDLVGDKLGRVHLGKQDLKTLQTRKMKGLKRSRDDDNENQDEHGDEMDDGDSEDGFDDDEEEMEGGIELIDDVSDDGSGGSGGGGGSDEEMSDAMPKRQRLA